MHADKKPLTDRQHWNHDNTCYSSIYVRLSHYRRHGQLSRWCVLNLSCDDFNQSCLAPAVLLPYEEKWHCQHLFFWLIKMLTEHAYCITHMMVGKQWVKSLGMYRWAGEACTYPREARGLVSRISTTSIGIFHQCGDWFKSASLQHEWGLNQLAVSCTSQWVLMSRKVSRCLFVPQA